MTISAKDQTRDDDLMSRALELYRDLSVALRERIAVLKTGVVRNSDDAKGHLELVRAHQRALQTVLDIEASLGKRSRTWGEGAGGELDLAAARAEIDQRLARWTAAG